MAKAQKQSKPVEDIPVEEVKEVVEEAMPKTIGDMYRREVLKDGTVREDF